jgi:hypothetical protein
MAVSSLVDADDLVLRRKVITLFGVGAVKGHQSAVQEEHGGTTANGLDVKSRAVNGIVLVGPAIAFSKSRDANESSKCDEKNASYVIHQIIVSNCADESQ